jgi:hypothetical protein
VGGCRRKPLGELMCGSELVARRACAGMQASWGKARLGGAECEAQGLVGGGTLRTSEEAEVGRWR